MYTVRLKASLSPRLRASLSTDGASVSAKTATLTQAFGFVREFCGLKYGWIDTPWQERDGRFVIDVYDWCDCWFADPPVLAQIVAPPDFILHRMTATA